MTAPACQRLGETAGASLVPEYGADLPAALWRVRPGPRRRGAGRLRLAEREEISRGLAAERSYREIATALDRARR